MVTSLSMPLRAGAVSADDFVDIKGHWAEEAMVWAVDNEVMNGTSGNTMSPDDTLTVAEFIVMIDRITLTDVEIIVLTDMIEYHSNHWADTSVRIAVRAGLTEGMDASYFVWDNTITRADMAVLVSNALTALKEEPGDTTGVSEHIADWDSIKDTPQAEAILTCFSKGIIGGTDSKGTFNAGGSVTRATAAVLAQRIMDSSVRLSYKTPSVPSSNQGVEPITIDMGTLATHRNPLPGDTVKRPDGTTVVLTSTRLGTMDILGYNQDVGPYLGIQTPAGVIGQDKTAYNRPDAPEDFDLYLNLEGTNTWHWRSEWRAIRDNTAPTTTGTSDGQVSSDGLFKWYSSVSQWVWIHSELTH